MSTERERLDEIRKKIKGEPEASGITPSASTVAAETPVPRRLGLGGALNTVTPCAACKLLRRRCAQECPFAPYFSPHEPQKFVAVHKVFGASNVSKMLLEVPEAERGDAVGSLVYEANLRLRDPVYGCMGAISDLQQQLNALETELEAVRAEIFKHSFAPVPRIAGPALAGLTDGVAQATASFVAPALPVHTREGVVSVAQARQEVTKPAEAPGMSTSAVVYVAEAVEQYPSSDRYKSLNTSEHAAYFG